MISAVAPARGLNVQIYSEIYKRIVPCEDFGALPADRAFIFAGFFRVRIF